MQKNILTALFAVLILSVVGCSPQAPTQEGASETTVTSATTVLNSATAITTTVNATTAAVTATTTQATTTAVTATTTTQATTAVTTTATTQDEPQPIYDVHTLDAAQAYEAIGGSIFDFKSGDPAHYIVQGGFFDGEKFYIAHISKLDGGFEQARILVLDYWGNPVRESEPLPLDHANCITYNDTIDRLVVAHCQSPDGHYSRYSYVDPETLTVTDTFDAPQPFFAIGYSKEKQRYASGQWAGQTLDFWDAEMNHLLSVNVEMPGSLSQGVYCDDTGVYFVRSSQNGFGSEIRVYDWNGNLTRTIPVRLPGNIEPESINIVDGITYVLGNDWTRGRGAAFILEYKPLD